MNKSMNDASQIFELSLIEYKIAVYSCLIILPLGLLTNSLNILVCMRKQILKQTMGFYSPIMSLFNMTSLFISFLVDYPPIQFVMFNSSLNCVLYSYLLRISLQMSSWLYVMCSLDRMLFITYPHRFKFLKKKSLLCLVCGILFVAICLLNVPNLWLTVVRADNSSTALCTSMQPNLVLVRDLIAQCMRTVLPVLIEATLNAFLILKLLQSRRNLNVRRSLQRDYKFAFTITVLNAAFLVTHLPLVASTLYLNALNYQWANMDASLELKRAGFFYVISILITSYMLTSVFFVNLFCNRLFKIECFKFVDEGAQCLMLVAANSGSRLTLAYGRLNACITHGISLVLAFGQFFTRSSKHSTPVLVSFTNKYESTDLSVNLKLPCVSTNHKCA